MPEPDQPVTITDDDIETRRVGAAVSYSGDDTADSSDTGDDSGDTSDTSDTGDDSGDTGDDAGDDSGSAA